MTRSRRSFAVGAGPIPLVTSRGVRDGALPAYVSNGLIGLRVREQPLQAGMMMVNGFAGEHPERRIEAAAAAPYPLAADLALNDVWLSEQPSSVSDLEQDYDFNTGELHSRFRYAAAGVVAEVQVTTFASRTAPALVLQEVVVVADRACDVTLSAIIDTARVRGHPERRRVDTPGEPAPVCDGSLLWRSEGGLSGCGLALATDVSDRQAKKTRADWDVSGPLRTEYRLRARAGRRIRLRQMAAAVALQVHARPDEEAVRRLARGLATGFAALRRRNRDAWAELWKGRIRIHGASARHQALVDAAVFYLNSSTHPASPAATSIFGLATWWNYTYYFGHVMWDIDAF